MNNYDSINRNIFTRESRIGKKNQRETENENNIVLSTSIEKKINSVNKEIDGMKTDELLLMVDPEIEAIETIEQIQNYYNLIKKEIQKIVKSYKIINQSHLILFRNIR
jgi:inorganic pyrophosphatase